jgi:hypothetical protein
MKILFKCSIMAIECGCFLRCKYCSLCFIVNVIFGVWGYYVQYGIRGEGPKFTIKKIVFKK